MKTVDTQLRLEFNEGDVESISAVIDVLLYRVTLH